eukprot:c4680_g1_i1 orf=590-1483(+)
MGKLLQKLVNGIVPSWLTKVKSSAGASPKKLLTFSRGHTHASSSHNTSASYPSSTANSTGALALEGHNQGDQSGEEEEPCAEACGENTTISESPSSIKQGRTASIWQKADMNDDKHHHQDHLSPHHPLLMDVDVKAHDNCCHDTQSSAHPKHRSSRKLQDILNIHILDNHEHDHHPRQHHRNCNDSEHQHQVEHHGNYDDPEDENESQCMQEDINNHHQRQEAWHTPHHVEPHQFRSGKSPEFSEFLREFQCLQEGNRTPRQDLHDVFYNGYECHNKGYHDLLGFKRKSQYLEEEEG